ncbi:MAG: hypothetical protein FJX77_15825, partial [Armatimonadetes bacterium]|nr:hypothetical protein [Armatimonadota bacterium]
MRCRGVRMQLSAYADGELAPRAARELEQHLASCEQCVAELARTRQIKRLTALVPTEELPAGLHSRLMTRLAYTSPTPTPVAASGMSPCDVWRALGLAGASVGLASLLLGQMSRGVAAPALPAPPLTNLVPASATATPGQPALPQPAPAVPVSPPVLSVQTDPTAGVAPAPPAAPAPGVEPAGLLPVPSERRVSGSVVRSR